MGWPLFGTMLAGVLLASTPAQVIERDVTPPAGQDDGPPLTIADFLRGVEAMRLGPERAEKDPDFLTAMRGLARIGENYRRDAVRAKAAGTTLDSCPPREMKVDTTTLIPFLLRVPPEQRSMPMEQAFRQHLRELFPCPSASGTQR